MLGLSPTTLIIYGAIVWVVGQLTKIGIAEKIGLYAIYIGVALWILGALFGINIL